MTNREKYAEQILDIACSGTRIAVKKNAMEPVPCQDIPCADCYLRLKKGSMCEDACKEWCESEYEEPSIDWSKIPVDTPILVKYIENDEWRRRYFAEFKDGVVYTWKDGKTSWSSLGFDKVDWEYAKLADDEV
nr:MAG TPA: hypothetical protein [Caudoviricetes sp.]